MMHKAVNAGLKEETTMKGLYKETFRRAAMLGMAMGLTLTQVVVAADTADTQKEETVYIFTDANGSQKKVLVDDWLKNIGAGSVEDSSILQDITNVKGDETYETGENGILTWNAEGSDIYYQGTTDEETPISVVIDYYLDGEKIAPEDLAGKSGKVTIRYTYTNHAAVSEQIGDTEEDVPVPFVVMTGMLFTDGRVKNVEVSSGKVVEEGDSTIVVGICLPGMQEALHMDSYEDLKFDQTIPDYVEVSMDAEDFQMNLSMSVAMNDAFDGLETDELSEAFEEAESEMDLLAESADKLVDGSAELADGLDELAEKTPDLVDGTKDLADGVSEYTDGVSTVKDGTDQLKDGSSALAGGADQLSDGAGTLAGGAGQAAAGAKQVSDGAEKLNDGAGTLAKGVKDLNKGAKKLEKGTGSALDGSKQLEIGAGTLAEGAASAKEGASALAGGLDSAQEGSAALKDGAEKLSEGVSAGAAAYAEEMGKIAESLPAQTAQLQALKDGIDAADEGAIDKVNAAIAALTQGLSALEDATAYTDGSLNESGLISSLESARTEIAAAYSLLGVGEITQLPANDSDSTQTGESEAQPADSKVSGEADTAVTEKNTDPDGTADAAQLEALKEAARSSAAAVREKSGQLTSAVEGAQDALGTARSSAETGAQSAGSAAGEASGASSAFDGLYASASALSALAAKTSYGDVISSALGSAQSVKGSYDSAVGSYESAVSSYADAAASYETVAGSYESLAGDVSALSGAYDEALGSYDQLIAAYQEQIEALQQENASLKAQNSEETSAADSVYQAASQQEIYAQAQALQSAYVKLTVAEYMLDNSSVNSTYIQGIAAQMSQSEDPQQQSAGQMLAQMASGDQSSGYVQGIRQMKAGLAQLQDSLTGVDTEDPANSGVLRLSSSALGQVLDLINTMTPKLTAVGESLGTLADGADQLAKGAESLDSGLGQLSSGAQTLTDGLGTLADGAAALADGTESLNKGLGTLSAGMKTLAGGISTMQEKAPTLVEGIGTLAKGAKTLSQGNTQLAAGAATLAGGAGTLAAGAHTLDNGIGTLQSGVNELDSNSAALKDGANELADGADTLADGVTKLDEGGRELADGIKKFNDEGIQKLMDLYEGDIRVLIDRLDGVVRAGQDYTNFSGLTDGMDGRVKFIIRTDGITHD